MSKRGWETPVIGAMLALWTTLAVVGYVYRGRIVALLPGRASAGPSDPPVPPTAFALPLAEAPTAMPFVGDDGEFSDGYPKKSVSVVGMRTLLRHLKFKELTEYVEQAEQAALLDYRREYWALDAVRGFNCPDPALESALDGWVAYSPKSFAPYAARAEYRSSRGWQARGSAVRSKTSREKFAALERWLALSSADLEKALELNPNAIAPRFLAVHDARQTGELEPKLKAALARSPESFLARYFAMLAEEPRWGGSYERMQAIADAARPHVGRNPRLALLPGVVESSRGNELANKKDFAGARAAAERALRVGEHWLFYSRRAEGRVRDGDYSGALADIDHGLALRTELDGLLVDRAAALWKLKRFEEAGDSFLEALRIDPTAGLNHLKTYSSAFEFAGRKYAKDGRPREALRAFEKAILLNPANGDAKRQGAELLALGDPSANEADVTAAVERARKEDTFDAYVALDALLARRGRFGEVIDHWTKYLEKHPTDGKAFLERGGAYTHIRRAAEAERDADSACKLGLQRGCELRANMQEIQKRWREASKE